MLRRDVHVHECAKMLCNPKGSLLQGSGSAGSEHSAQFGYKIQGPSMLATDQVMKQRPVVVRRISGSCAAAHPAGLHGVTSPKLCAVLV